MDTDRNLFVEAFWVKCREVIRPELDRVVDRLRGKGANAEISTQEIDDNAAASPGPSLTLTASDAVLSFYGDVAAQTVRAVPMANDRLYESLAYTLDQLDEGEVAAIVAAWEAEQPSQGGPA
jgi:hypothetical protein